MTFALTLLPQRLPLGHSPTVVKSAKSWSGRRDSNPRPRPWQGRALPLSYTRIREIGGDHSPATRRAMPNAALECNSPRAIFESGRIARYREVLRVNQSETSCERPPGSFVAGFREPGGEVGHRAAPRFEPFAERGMFRSVHRDGRRRRAAEFAGLRSPTPSTQTG